MPVAEPLGKATPLTAMLGHIEDCVEHLQIVQAYIPALQRKARFDLLVLLGRDFHLS
jgi:hypothetical protein